MSRVAFRLFSVNIYWYSLCILFGIVVAYFLINKESKKHKIPSEFVTNLVFYTVLFGILGARIYYVLFNLSYYLKHISEIFAVWNGGLAIHGGLIAGAIFVYFYTKRYSINFLKILDILAPAIIIAQAFGRWGNFFNQEAYGSPVTLKFLKDIGLPTFIINGMNINGNYYFPTFYFESAWCTIGFLVLLFIRKRENLKLGTLSGIYLIWYGFGRFFIEILRTDSLMLFNFKVAQIVSIIGIVTGIVILVISHKKNIKYLEVKK